MCIRVAADIIIIIVTIILDDRGNERVSDGDAFILLDEVDFIYLYSLLCFLKLIV